VSKQCYEMNIICSDVFSDTLRTLHLLAKADAEKYGSLFKPISSLRLPEATDKDTLEASPVYGFKRDLVRLIGNMCFQCKANQDLVRERNRTERTKKKVCPSLWFLLLMQKSLIIIY